jgi:hypothetical protein
MLLASVETQHLKRGTHSLFSNARHNGYRALWHKRDAVGSRPGLENRLSFQCQRIDPGDARRSPVGHEDHAFGRDDTGRFRETRQRRDVPAFVMVDHLDAVSTGVRDEDTPALWIEGAVIE